MSVPGSTSWAEEVSGSPSSKSPPPEAHYMTAASWSLSFFSPIGKHQLQSYQNSTWSFLEHQLIWKQLLAYQNESPQDDSFHSLFNNEGLCTNHTVWMTQLPTSYRAGSITCCNLGTGPTDWIRTRNAWVFSHSSHCAHSMETRRTIDGFKIGKGGLD